MKRVFTTAMFMMVIALASIDAFGQGESREGILAKIQSKKAELEAKRTELQELEKKFFEPTAEDVAAYTEFLQQPDTGITRLLPRETFDKGQFTTRGGGAYYSFTRRSHEYGYGTQIGLEQDTLSTCFAGADYGMLVRLGDIPLGSLNSENPAVNFLASYNTPSEEPVARSEYRRFADGVRIENVLYKTHQQAILNHTYVLRGIHYSDSDVLVAFRIVRKDLDDSVIILWKLMRRYPKPVLARND